MSGAVLEMKNGGFCFSKEKTPIRTFKAGGH
jgi:hypothetical protein